MTNENVRVSEGWQFGLASILPDFEGVGGGVVLGLDVKLGSIEVLGHASGFPNFVRVLEPNPSALKNMSCLFSFTIVCG